MPALHGAVDRFVEDLAARESHDDAVGLLRDRRLEVVELFLKVAVLLQEHHLAVGLDLAAGLVHAFLHGLPEDVGRVRMVEIGVPLLCSSGRGTENQPADGPRGKQPSLAHHHWPPSMSERPFRGVDGSTIGGSALRAQGATSPRWCGCPAVGLRPAEAIEPAANLICAFDHDLECGWLANRRVFTDEKLPGFCDGSVIDTAGYLWNAPVEPMLAIHFDSAVAVAAAGSLGGGTADKERCR